MHFGMDIFDNGATLEQAEEERAEDVRFLNVDENMVEGEPIVVQDQPEENVSMQINPEPMEEER